MSFCANCGTQVQDNAAFCGGCGKPAAAPAASSASSPVGAASAPAPAPVSAPVPTAPATTNTGMADNVAGMVAYITIIPAILFLVMEPYNKNKFVRFHSFQSLFLGIAWFVFWTLMTIVLSPILGFFLAHTLLSLIGLGVFVLWIVLLLKAYQGQVFKVPVIGDIAEKQAGQI